MARTTPVDPKNDHVTEREMNDAADRAIYDQVARSTPMTRKK